ncbi:MAG: hypothetical protein HYX72_10370 [Acidobacteria bacterium]|nr:hypothetical protein [Acidobacteriota bacterium]
MGKILKRIGSAALGMALLMTAASFVCSASPAAAKAARSAKAPQVNLDDYVGPEVCSGCHSDQAQQLQKTPMAVLLTEKYPVEQRGCEACHGPGKAHVDALSEGNPDFATLIYSFARHTPQENAIRCLTCHQEKRLLGGKEKDEKQSLFHRSRHLGAGVTCIDCHDPHLLPQKETAKPGLPLQTAFNVRRISAERDWLNNRLLRQTEPTLCYSCHQERQADFQLPVRHRVNEGLVKCTDCHNPHGTLMQKELKGTFTEHVCYSCHVEKRGPFVYEHAPVRVEGCLACHTPHGSINRNLLIRRQDRQLCLECHVSPQAVNVPHPRGGFQTAGECTRCHIEIHGSNYQPQFLR